MANLYWMALLYPPMLILTAASHFLRHNPILAGSKPACSLADAWARFSWACRSRDETRRVFGAA
ncbi:hypothetical protein SAMN05421881_102511 [Nitrosomonas halophila]|uniref:Uncharacterized protein n=1 Tax=Nitrosomonas halophila TaxID=44576 RepID=A0A1H3I960_9PROT|nr:hypothetical protein SAMN05421881_102511 [Nitrosomonas halophila]